MVNTRTVIIAIIVLAVGVGAYILLSESEEDRIKKRLHTLGEILHKKPGESPILAASKAGKVQKYFTETCNVRVQAYNFSENVLQGELSRYTLRARAAYDSLKVDFKDFVIALPSENQAELTVTVMVTGKMSSNEQTRDTQEVSCRLEKNEEEWFIREIEIVQVLEK